MNNKITDSSALVFLSVSSYVPTSAWFLPWGSIFKFYSTLLLTAVLIGIPNTSRTQTKLDILVLLTWDMVLTLIQIIVYYKWEVLRCPIQLWWIAILGFSFKWMQTPVHKIDIIKLVCSRLKVSNYIGTTHKRVCLRWGFFYPPPTPPLASEHAHFFMPSDVYDAFE